MRQWDHKSAIVRPFNADRRRGFDPDVKYMIDPEETWGMRRVFTRIGKFADHALLSPQEIRRVVLASDKDLVEFLSLRPSNYVSDMSTLPAAVFERISCCRDISVDFLIQHADRVDWNLVSMYNKLSHVYSDLHRARHYLNWKWICQYHELSEAFMEAHVHYLDWRAVCRYQHLSRGFIRRHAASLDWRVVSKYQTLSSGLLREYSSHLDWSRIARHQRLTSKSIWEHVARFDWTHDLAATGLLDNPHFSISPELFARFVRGGFCGITAIHYLPFTKGQVCRSMGLVYE